MEIGFLIGAAGVVLSVVTFVYNYRQNRRIDARAEPAKALPLEILDVQFTATPKPVEDLFKKLTDALPKHQSPREFDWTLTVIEAQDVNAFTVGGSFVYVLQPVLDALRLDGVGADRKAVGKSKFSPSGPQGV